MPTLDSDTAILLSQCMYDMLLAETEPGCLSEVASSDEFQWLNGTPIFTILGLYSVFKERYFELFGELEFNPFQQLLFKSDLNTRLSKAGYCIEVYNNQGKVALNWYQMKQIVAE